MNKYGHYHVYHGTDEFVRVKSHINWIESFLGFTKHKLAKFNGLTDKGLESWPKGEGIVLE